MKKFSISLLSLLLCCIVFTGCFGKKDPKLVLDVKPANEAINYSAVAKVDLGENVSMVGSITENGNVVVAKQVDTKTHHGVFSLVENKIVWAMRDSKEITLITDHISGIDYVKAKLEPKVEGEQPRYSIYTLDGDNDVLFSELNEVNNLFSVENDDVDYEIWETTLNGIKTRTVYALSNNTREKIFTRDINPYLDEDVYPAKIAGGKDGGSLIVRTTSTASGMRYIVETENGKVKADYIVDELNLEAKIYFDKFAILQYRTPVDMYSTKYDYIDNETGEKFNIVTYKINQMNGKKSKIDCDYVLGNSMNNVADNAVLTSVNKIINGRVYEDMATSAIVFETGKIQVLNYAYEEIKKLGDNRFAARFDSTYHIINEKFEVLAECDNSKIMATTDSYMLIDEGTYCNMINFDGKVIASPKYTRGEFREFSNGYAVFEDAVGTSVRYIRIDANGEEKVIGTKDGSVYTYGTTAVNGIVVNNGFVIVVGASTSGKTMYTLYNYAGDALRTIETETLSYVSIIPTEICDGKYRYFKWNDDYYIVK